MSGSTGRRLLLIFGQHLLEIGAWAGAFSCCTASMAAPIAPGNLLVVRAAGGPNGDATAALQGSGTAAGVFLDEYTTTGSFVQSIAMPTTSSTTVGGQRALTLSGTQNLEGHLTLSGNGQYFVMAGYNCSATSACTNNVTSTGGTTNAERIVGRIDLNGNVDTSTALIDAMSQQSVRAAYSTDGTNFWVTGNGGNGATVNSVANTPTTGVRYAQFGVNTGGTTTSTQLNTTGLNANSRYVVAVNGSLHVSSGNTSSPAAPNRGVDIMSGGIATTTGQTLSSLPGFPPGTAGTPLSNPQPDDFWFLNDSTIYLADNRVDGNGGIQKWTLSAGTWSMQYTLAGTLTSVVTPANKVGIHGLTGMVNPLGQTVLFATTFDSTGANRNQFFSVIDTGASSAVNILATSATNTAFRGIEIALLPPVPATPEPGSFVLLAMGLVLAGTKVRRRS